MEYYYLIRESFAQSVISDTYTVLILLGGASINKFWIGDSSFFNAVFAIMFIYYLYAKATAKVWKFDSKLELIRHLEKTAGE